MNDSDKQKLAQAVAMLRAAGESVRDLEKRAGEALHDRADEPEYRKLMREKCQVLMDLPEKGEAILAGAKGAICDDLRAAVASFASRAGQAVKIGSVFYMAALLYPDDYKDGDPNGIEEAVARFAEML
ncbi:MAG: hypothetical protein HQK81_03145 [Desulfovibrionaceae bacterium]|nr:hypothetical protein [Desulfovibrionaceae bacterium]MBF0513042.1 hypothetical protein [Desulfovibrionaceae bacterium]